MKAFAHLPIKRKLLVIMLLVNLTTLLAISSFLILNKITTLRNITADHYIQLARSIGTHVQTPLAKNKPELVKRYLETLNTWTHVIGVVIYDKTGRVFAIYQRDKSTAFSAPPIQHLTSHFDSIKLSIFIDIPLHNQSIGTVYIQTDLQAFNTLTLRFIGILSIVLIIALLFSLGLSAKLQTTITFPITNLLTTMDRHIEQPSNVISVSNRDELMQLTNKLNRIFSQMQTQTVELTQYQIQEGEIQSRIEELSKSNSALESHLAQLKESTEAVEQAKNAFLMNIGYAVRMPLHAMLGMIDWLRSTTLTEAQQEYVKTLKVSANTLLNLTHEVADFSQIQTDTLALENKPFKLKACIEEALAAVASQATTKQLPLNYYIDADIPLLVSGDKPRFQQILASLLSNAVKFTQQGKIDVIVTGHSLPAGNLKLYCAVKDTGIGIAPEHISQLFQPSTQTTNLPDHTGLSLVICKHLCNLMRGHIWVDSAENKGSTFHFTATLETLEPVDTTQTTLTGRHMLVVGETVEVLSLQLEALGSEVKLCTSAEEALKALTQTFELAILALQPPQNLALAQQMRQQIETLPLVMVADKPLEMEVGLFQGMLVQPVKIEALVQCLDNLLATKGIQFTSNQPSSAEITEPSSSSGLRILLTEDNVTNQKVASLLLKRIGYTADIAENGLEAVQALEKQAYDVILMDIQMPEMDGFEATKQIRTRWPEESPYIIATTAHAMRGYREKCLQAGMDDYITKPVRPEELVTAIARCPRFQTLPEQVTSTYSEVAQGASEQIVTDMKEVETAPTEKVEANEKALITTIRDALIALVGEEESALTQELITTYLEGSETLITDLQAALATRFPEGLAQTAHSLKSSSASLGATDLAELCRQLEQKGRASDLQETDILVDKILTEYQRVKQALNTIIGVEQPPVEAEAPLPPTSPPVINTEVTDTSTSLSVLEAQLKDTLITLVGEEESDLLVDLVQAYCTESATLMDELHQAMSDNEYDRIAKVAHSLKSSSGNLGATTLAEHYSILEQQAKAEQLQDSATVLTQLETDYQQVIQALQNIIKRATGQVDSPTEAEIASRSHQIKKNLLTLVGDDNTETLCELLTLYQKDTPGLLEAIREALANKEAKTLTRIGHTLKSSSSNLGAATLADLATSLETCGYQEDFKLAASLFVQLETEYATIDQAITQLMQQWATAEKKTLSTERPNKPTIALQSPEQVQILVVDDQPYDTLLVSTFLQEEGYRVLTANTGQDALNKVVASSPNVVLSDVMMPGMDGFEVCQRIKEDEQTMHIPVVLVTALEGRDDRIKGIQAGADEFLSKPINREEMLARIRSLLRYQQARAQLEEAQKEHLKSLFKRYVSPKLVDEILEDPGGKSLLVDRQNRLDAVILFADLRGFTAMSEMLKPPEVVSLLNEFFTMLTEVGYRYDGTIFNMAGDCLLIGFGVPFQQAEVAQCAIKAAIDMQHEFVRLDEAWQTMYGIDVGLGVGINKGEIIAGNVGSPNYMNYTVIGDTVNVASRLVSLAKRGEIILSQSMVDALQHKEISKRIEALAPVNLKGKSQPQQVYRIKFDASLEM